MTAISFGKKKGFASSEAQRIPIDGLEVSHLGSKQVVHMQGTVMNNGQLYKTGVGLSLPDDPVHIGKLIDELERLKQYLTSKHIR